MEKERKKLSPKAKKIINIVVDVVCAVILVFALILAISIIKSKRKNYDSYTEIFGKAYLAVASDSMEPTFYKGDLIVVKILNGKSEQSSLKVGDIITFNDNKLNGNGDKIVLNTHRIIAIEENAEGYIFYTQGDKYTTPDSGFITSKDVVGKYEGKASGIGNVMLFMGSSAGFFVFVVLPTLIIVAIAAANLVIVILKEKKAQNAVAEKAQQEVLADERERIRQELLAEMQMQNQATAGQEKPEEPQETETVQADSPAVESEEKPAGEKSAETPAADDKKE